jgi:putative acetyltransferase
VTIAVRPVVGADVQAVVALVTDVLAEFGLVFGVGAATDAPLLGLPASYEDAGGAFWVAEQAGHIVGTCGLAPIVGEDPGVYELRKMYLRPSTRGHGLGKQLLELAIAWARARGGTHIVLDTIEEMTRAIAFYEAHGFVRDDTQKRGARCTRGYALRL